jgi:choline dehydrogenase
MMIAEKAADLIAGNTPLPAEPIPFYRHKSDASLGLPGDAGRLWQLSL